MKIPFLTIIYFVSIILDKLAFVWWHFVLIILLDVFLSCGGSLITVNYNAETKKFKRG